MNRIDKQFRSYKQGYAIIACNPKARFYTVTLPETFSLSEDPATLRKVANGELLPATNTVYRLSGYQQQYVAMLIHHHLTWLFMENVFPTPASLCFVLDLSRPEVEFYLLSTEDLRWTDH